MSTPARKRSAGRRTLLTDEVQERIVTAVRGGNYLDDAARYGGVTDRTVLNWMQKGREALAEVDGEDDLVAPEMEIYVRFFRAIEKARSDAVVRNLTLVQRAAEDNWQAAAWYLERTNPRKWGRRDTLEVTGEDGGPVQVHVSARETLAEKFAAAERAAREVIEAQVIESDETPRLRAAQ